MTYVTDKVATALKAAREHKGMSQRDLAGRSGVPQSHISKIEASSVDLRLSSLSALAHALDLEIVLVPRKAMPAVTTILRAGPDEGSRPAYSLDDEEAGDA